jgi:succinate dehydrogenase / fumarate reductase membrane anchor subunit
MTRDVPHGSGHWLAQRITAVALIPLGLWFVFSLATRADLSRRSWLEFMAAPWHAAALLLFLLVLLYHSHLGVQVVIDDYVHAGTRLRALRLLSGLAHIAAALLGLLAVFRIVSDASV